MSSGRKDLMSTSNRPGLRPQKHQRQMAAASEGGKALFPAKLGKRKCQEAESSGGDDDDEGGAPLLGVAADTLSLTEDQLVPNHDEGGDIEPLRNEDEMYPVVPKRYWWYVHELILCMYVCMYVPL